VRELDGHDAVGREQDPEARDEVVEVRNLGQHVVGGDQIREPVLRGQARGEVDAEELAARYREICYDLIPEMVKPAPGALACLQELVADGIPVGILTNGWSELQERKIEHALGEFPGPLLVSDVIGAYKPSAAAFRALENALGVAAERLWYVGDNPSADIVGAHAYGLRTVWLNEGGHAYPAGLEPPTATIEHLDALAAVVRGT